MPDSKSTSCYRSIGENVYREERRGSRDYSFLVAEAQDADTAAVIAAALNDAVEHPWVDGGPTVEEAGDTILVRRDCGRLFPAEWIDTWRYCDNEWPVGEEAVGWRTMPRVGK